MGWPVVRMGVVIFKIEGTVVVVVLVDEWVASQKMVAMVVFVYDWFLLW